MSARYTAGEIVDVTVRGARVVGADMLDRPDELVTLAGVDLDVTDVQVTVRRTVPADGVPQPGDVWVGRFGAKYFVRAGVQDNVVLVPADPGSLSQLHWESVHAGAEGPIRLLWREGWSPAPVNEPAASVVDGSPGKPTADEPSYAESLRELAGWLDANPDMPMPPYTLHVTGSLGGRDTDKAVDAAHRACDLLGVPVDDTIAGATGKRHVRAERTFGKVEFSLSSVTDPSEAESTDEPVLRDDQDEWAEHDAAEHDAVRADVEAEGEAELAEERAAAMGGERP